MFGLVSNALVTVATLVLTLRVSSQLTLAVAVMIALVALPVRRTGLLAVLTGSVDDQVGEHPRDDERRARKRYDQAADHRGLRALGGRAELAARRCRGLPGAAHATVPSTIRRVPANGHGMRSPMNEMVERNSRIS